MKPKLLENKVFFVIKIPIYHCDIAFSLGQSDEEVRNSMVGFETGQYDFKLDTALGRCTNFGVAGPYLVRTRLYPSTPKYKAILIHEILHSVIFILRNREINLVYDSEEVFTYLMEYITEKAFENLKS